MFLLDSFPRQYISAGNGAWRLAIFTFFFQLFDVMKSVKCGSTSFITLHKEVFYLLDLNLFFFSRIAVNAFTSGNENHGKCYLYQNLGNGICSSNFLVLWFWRFLKPFNDLLLLVVYFSYFVLGNVIIYLFYFFMDIIWFSLFWFHCSF